MNQGPQLPQSPNSNPPLSPGAGFEQSAGEIGGAHLLERHNTEMMQPPSVEQPARAQQTQQGTPTERLYPHSRESYDSISPVQRTAMALASLNKLGDSVVVWMPGSGNTRMTLAGTDPRGNPIYREQQMESAAQPKASALSVEATRFNRPDNRGSHQLTEHEGPFMGAPFGPSSSTPEVAEFGPQGGSGSRVQPMSTPGIQDRRPAETAPDPYADVEPEFFTGIGSSGSSRAQISEPETGNNSEVVAEETPPIENIKPETVQTTGNDEAEEDLADQLLKNQAPPIAEMPEEHRPDTFAVRHAGAAAAVEHAQETASPEDEGLKIQGVGNRLPDDEEPVSIADILPDVVREGERPPEFGGGQPRYRR